jgi:hypothetical protein
MRPWLAVVFCTLLGGGPAWAACAGPPYDEFDFWLGSWHDPAALAAEHYAVRRTAGGCAIEEVLTGGNGQIQGIGLSGWDSERKQWRQLWADKDRIVTVYMGGPVADGTFVLTSECRTIRGGAGAPRHCEAAGPAAPAFVGLLYPAALWCISAAIQKRSPTSKCPPDKHPFLTLTGVGIWRRR